MNSNNSLSYISRYYGFDKLVLLGPSEERKSRRENQNVLADVFEAYIGALFGDARRRGVVHEAEEWIAKLLSFEVFTDMLTLGEARLGVIARAGERESEEGKRKRSEEEDESDPPSSKRRTSVREGGMRSSWPEDEALI